MPAPQRGRAYTCTVFLIATVTGRFLPNPPLATGDFLLSKDGGAFAPLATLPVVSPAGSVCVQVTLAAAEMDAAHIVVQAVDPDGVWEHAVVDIQTTVTLGDDGRVLLSTDPQPIIPADLVELAGNPTSPLILDQSARTMVRGVVGSGATTTSLPTSSLLPAAVQVDQWKHRVLVFDDTTGTPALRGQTCDLIASTVTGVLTVTALTTAPVAGDTFMII